MPSRPWTRDEQLVVLRLYFRLPFGRLSATNGEIKALADAIGRTANAVAMKACNFASLDPHIIATGRKGLANLSQGDRDLWAEFQSNSEAVANEAETAYEQLATQSLSSTSASIAEQTHQREEGGRRPDERPEPGPYNEPTQTFPIPTGPTDFPQLIRARRVQSFFRHAVLTSYESRCAITGLAEPSLLVASHIIPWSANISRRADPTNGLCLSALFDQAFDRGLITIDNDLRVVVSKRLRTTAAKADLPCSIPEAHGRPIQLPIRLTPDATALDHHRTNVFCDA